MLVRLVPKGRDKAADYMIGPETKRNLGSGLPWEEDVVNWRESATGNVLETREKGEFHHGDDHSHDLLPTLWERGFGA